MFSGCMCLVVGCRCCYDGQAGRIWGITSALASVTLLATSKEKCPICLISEFNIGGGYAYDASHQGIRSVAYLRFVRQVSCGEIHIPIVGMMCVVCCMLHVQRSCEGQVSAVGLLLVRFSGEVAILIVAMYVFVMRMILCFARQELGERSLAPRRLPLASDGGSLTGATSFAWRAPPALVPDSLRFRAMAFMMLLDLSG